MNSLQIAVMGGSVAGLKAAEEAALLGATVTVYEEHREIGVPEKCDGLVSSRGLAELGVVPSSHAVQNRLTKATFFSPSGKEFEIDASKQNVIVLDRARFDKELAEKAARAGARIEVGKRISSYLQTEDGVQCKLEGGTLHSDYFLDCSGYESYIRSGGDTVQGAQYLVFGKWFQKSKVEVYLDPEAAPGFFFWVIPISQDMAKIGMGGVGINTFAQLDEFAKKKGAVPIRKMAAPIACYGTIKAFVEGRIARAGDAAGQAKPTTGGGIYTGGYGGMLAGRAAAVAAQEKTPDKLGEYEASWRSKFGNEFRLQLYGRKIFCKLTAKQLDQLFESIRASELPRKLSEEGDFDLHSVSIAKAFGASKVLEAAGMILTNEVRALLSY